jgi:ATP-dependent DNA helicase RecQ
VSTAAQLLKKFGHAQFHAPQQQVIENLLAGRNTLCLMPTGSGKSLCYQIAGLLLEKTTVVLFPLRALAAQQAKILREEHGLDVTAIDAGMSGQEQYTQLRKILDRPPNFIFFSVERASQDGFLEHVLRRLRDIIGLVTIDEAHCVSQWGDNFRPAYKEIPDFLDRVFLQSKKPPVLCLTATLNERDQEEVCRDFAIAPSDVLRSASLFRTNLELRREVLADEKAKPARLEQLLREHEGQKVLIYVHRKRGDHGTSALNAAFSAKGFPCDYFDADLDTDERTRVLEEFRSGAKRIVFATGAFGMGIHIPDIRVVIHYLMPESIEQYYQEAGRAGRDGKPSVCHLLFTDTNIRVRGDLIKEGFPSAKTLTAFYQEVLHFEEGDTAELEPLTALQDENLLCFYLLKTAGIFDVIARGLRSVQDFAPGSAPPRFAEYASASRLGLTRIISMKTGASLQEIMSDLFTWFSEGRLKLARAPGKMLFVQKRKPLTDNVLAEIEASIADKKEYRLRGLEKFVAMIKSPGPPEHTIKAHLGI